MREKYVSFEDAVNMIKDGDSLIICESSLDRSPTAIVREIIRRKMGNLTLVSIWGGYSSDLLIGAGLVRRVEVAYMGFESLGPAPCFRRAVENEEIEVEDYSNLMMFARLRAGATGVPFYPLKSALGSDIMRNLVRKGKAREIECPFTGEKVCVVPALKPDVAVIHAHAADSHGNTLIDGVDRLAYDMATASNKVIVSVERKVDHELMRCSPRATIQGAVIPGMLVDAVVYAPYGAHPTACLGFYNLDSGHLERYIKVANDAEKIRGYLQKYVYGTKSHMNYLNLVGKKRLLSLKQEPKNCKRWYK